jgi:hypothetical protein
MVGVIMTMLLIGSTSNSNMAADNTNAAATVLDDNNDDMMMIMGIMLYLPDCSDMILKKYLNIKFLLCK